MSENRRHHYVPQFYLRHFSDSTRKRIAVFNCEKWHFIPLAAIKTQAQRYRLYERPEVEQTFGEFEACAAPIVKRAIDCSILPEQESRDHTVLLAFVMLMHSRTPAHLDKTRRGLSEMTREALRGHPDALDLIEVEDLSLMDSAQIALNNVFDTLPFALDLRLTVLENCTSNAFITSDNPCIFTNPYLECRKRWCSNTGLATKGLIILLPLSPRRALMAFDESTYRVDQSDKILRLRSTNDVDAINLLQGVHSERLLFSEPGTAAITVSSIASSAKRFRVKYRSQVRKLPVLNWEPNRELIQMRNWDVRTGFKMTGLRLRTRVGGQELSGSAAEYRNPHLVHALKRMGPRMTGGVSIKQMIHDIRSRPVSGTGDVAPKPCDREASASEL